MEIEIYNETKLQPAASELDNEPDFSRFEDYAAQEDYRLSIKLCRNLGLTAQRRQLTPVYLALSLRQKLPFPFLSPEQEQALARIFPTRYKQTLTEEDLRGATDLSTLRTLDCYAFDRIPLDVLTCWNDAQERGLFHAYEIWTRESRGPDPVLIGRRAEHQLIYLLCRWGETLQTWQELSRRSPGVLELPAGRRTS